MPVPDHVPDLPDPSPELVLIMALTHAYVRSLSRKERDRFMLSVSESLGMQEASLNVLRFRPRHEDKAVYRSLRGARNWWSQSLAVLVRLTE